MDSYLTTLPSRFSWKSPTRSVVSWPSFASRTCFPAIATSACFALPKRHREKTIWFTTDSCNSPRGHSCIFTRSFKVCNSHGSSPGTIADFARSPWTIPLNLVTHVFLGPVDFKEFFRFALICSSVAILSSAKSLIQYSVIPPPFKNIRRCFMRQKSRAKPFLIQNSNYFAKGNSIEPLNTHRQNHFYPVIINMER